MSLLIDQIAAQRAAAAKNGDTALRNLLSTLHAEAARIGKDARNEKSTDDEVLKTVQKFMKNAEESVKALEASGRGEDARAEALRQEIRFLSLYLPAQMTEDELRDAIAKAASESGATSVKDMGKVMAVLKAAHAGSYDGAAAARLAKEFLAKTGQV